MDTQTFEKKLAKAIEECGGWITKHAEDIAGKAEGRTDLEITIDMGLNLSAEAPTITIRREHVPLEAFVALYNGRETKNKHDKNNIQKKD